MQSNNDRGSNNSTAAFASETGEIRDSGLPNKVGMLDVQPTQIEPQYLGSSSAFAFSHLINPSLRCAITPKISQQEGLGQIEISPTPCPLPEYATALTLSNAYFENIHPQYPFLHEPTFRRYEQSIMGVPSDTGNLSMPITSTAPLFFINMVRTAVSERRRKD